MTNCGPAHELALFALNHDESATAIETERPEIHARIAKEGGYDREKFHHALARA